MTLTIRRFLPRSHQDLFTAELRGRRWQECQSVLPAEKPSETMIEHCYVICVKLGNTSCASMRKNDSPRSCTQVSQPAVVRVLCMCAHPAEMKGH